MSWHIYDAKGRRVQKLTSWEDGTATLGWVAEPEVCRVYGGRRVFGFSGECAWRPTFFVAKMARGYRVFGLDVGEFDLVTTDAVVEWWQPASLDHKRLPTIAAVEAWIRHVGVNH